MEHNTRHYIPLPLIDTEACINTYRDMVRGWESRVDLANKRKEEAREKKQARKGPKRITGEVVLACVLAADAPTDVQDYEAWLRKEDGPGKEVCMQHFRAEACGAKRCKYSHSSTISMLKHVEESGGAGDAHMHLSRVADLTSIPVGEHIDLQFLLWRGECVFDACHAGNWERFHEEIKLQRRELLKLGDIPVPGGPAGCLLPAIPEEHIDEDLCQGIDRLAVGRVGGSIPLSPAVRAAMVVEDEDIKSTSTCSWTSLPVWVRVLRYCSDAELCRAVEICRGMQGCIHGDEILRARRREHLAATAITGKDLSKQRKNEKKKKLKAANCGVSDKKDGHKKVRVCRR